MPIPLPLAGPIAVPGPLRPPIGSGPELEFMFPITGLLFKSYTRPYIIAPVADRDPVPLS